MTCECCGARIDPEDDRIDETGDDPENSAIIIKTMCPNCDHIQYQERWRQAPEILIDS